MISQERAQELAAMLEPICGENLRGIRDHHLEAVRKVYKELMYGMRSDA